VQVDNTSVPGSEWHGRRRVFPHQTLGSILCLLAALALPGNSQAEDADSVAAGPETAPVPFTVGKRQDKLFFYPCADCHDYMDANSNVRDLEVEEGHPAKLEHGNGLFWCFSCHNPDNYGQLRTPLAETIGFDSGYRVCDSCHSGKYQDWTYGGHGKRVANWRGERTLYSCVECHNPHHPAIPPRAPKPPPPIRAGLKPMKPAQTGTDAESHRPVWEQSNAR